MIKLTNTKSDHFSISLYLLGWLRCLCYHRLIRSATFWVLFTPFDICDKSQAVTYAMFDVFSLLRKHRNPSHSYSQNQTFHLFVSSVVFTLYTGQYRRQQCGNLENAHILWSADEIHNSFWRDRVCFSSNFNTIESYSLSLSPCFCVAVCMC